MKSREDARALIRISRGKQVKCVIADQTLWLLKIQSFKLVQSKRRVQFYNYLFCIILFLFTVLMKYWES